ncbi:hypothetical protein MRB53_021280 [Persea americana]|uniref:Uncharacterized protein n=1 Tax=Persea americana TaxID=3435 RepID=A0ACC2L4M0_PERAE|nr:hypothetical protein MRB53_021280 [Persea americana]
MVAVVRAHGWQSIRLGLRFYFQSTMASSSSTTTMNQASSLLCTNITHLVIVKLDKENFLLWQSQFEPLLHYNDLYSHVDGSTPCPIHYLQGTSRTQQTLNPAHTSLQKQDQTLVSWIKSTLTEHALTQVVRLKTGFEIWKFLELQYSTRSRSRKAQLLLQLQTLRKGTSNITDYLHRAKFIADSLAAIGYPVPDEDLILAIVGGLPKSYDNLYMHVTSNSDSTSIEELHSLMLSQEVRPESQEQDDVTVNPPTTAFVATKYSSSQPPRGQSNNRSRGQG